MKEKYTEESNEKMRLLKKHFRFLKLKSVVFWLSYNVAVDVASGLLFLGNNIEILFCIVIVSTIVSTAVMINSLNKWDKLKAIQEAQLLEETPLSRFKL